MVPHLILFTVMASLFLILLGIFATWKWGPEQTAVRRYSALSNLRLAHHTAGHLSCLLEYPARTSRLVRCDIQKILNSIHTFLDILA